MNDCFLHDRSWPSPWMKSISNELVINIYVNTSQLSAYCEVICNRVSRHQQNENRENEIRGRCVEIVVLSLFMDSLCRVRNKIRSVLSWRTVYARTRVLFFVFILKDVFYTNFRLHGLAASDVLNARKLTLVIYILCLVKEKAIWAMALKSGFAFQIGLAAPTKRCLGNICTRFVLDAFCTRWPAIVCYFVWMTISCC